jgi:hypothetical protein
MSRFPVIDGGPATAPPESYADRLAPKPPTVEELRCRLELNLRHLCLVFAWFDERERSSFEGIRHSHADFGRLLEEMGKALSAGES